MQNVLAEEPSAQQVSPSLEDLLAIEITTLGRRVQPVHDVAGAVTVVTGADLQRGGARTVLDVLAQVPGVSVERYNGRLASVAVRGDGSSRFARNVLVLLDGQSQYSALFGGVQWELLDLPLDLVERVEVLRGAGSALWGGHAVNSVINIVTRHDAGRLASMQADSSGRLNGTLRWAAPESAGETWAPALWANLGHQPGSQTLRGRDDWDNETMLAVGGTVRRTWTDGGELRIDADHRQSDGGHDLAGGGPGSPQVIRADYFVSTSQVGTQWLRVDSSGASLELSASLQSTRSRLGDRYDLQSDALDLDGQRLWRLPGNELQIGGSASWTRQRELMGAVPPPPPPPPPQQQAPPPQALQPPRPQDMRRSLRAYVQDEWSFDADRTAVIAAVQTEYFTGSGTTLSPALRIRHTVSPQLALWAAAALSANEPIENDLSGGGGPRDPPPPPNAASPPPGQPGAPGNPGRPPGGPPSAAQRGVPSLDLGLHGQPMPGWRWNAAAYWQHYRDSMTPSPPGGTPGGTPVTVTGAEIDMRWQPAGPWDLSAAWSLANAHLQARASGSRAQDEANYLGAVPRWRLVLINTLRLDETRRLDVAFDARSALPAAQLPRTGRLDLTYRQRLGQQLEWGAQARQINHRRLLLYGPSESGALRFESDRGLRVWLSWTQR